MDGLKIEFNLRPSPKAEDWANKFIAGRSWKQGALVAISPGALMPHKKWPLLKYLNLVKMLLSRYENVKFLVIGSPLDKVLADEISELNPQRVINLCGINIDESAAILKHVNLAIGNDGGAMHLAAAMGCKVVSMIPGIEHPNSVYPWNNANNVVQIDVNCAPCYSFSSCPRGDNRCMVEIPFELVLSRSCIAIEQLLSSN